MRATDFWTKSGTAVGNCPPNASLSLRTSDAATSNELQMMFRSDTPIEQQLAVADRVLREVQRWRDGIAEYADRQRTAADELETARAEIARLKAEAGELA